MVYISLEITVCFVEIYINLSCSTNRLECVYIVFVDKLTFSNIELFQCDLLYLCAKRKTKKIISLIFTFYYILYIVSSFYLNCK